MTSRAKRTGDSMATKRAQSGRAVLAWTLFGVVLLGAFLPLLSLCLAPGAAEVVATPEPAVSEPAPVQRHSVPEPVASRNKEEPAKAPAGQRIVEAAAPPLILPLEVEFLGSRAS